MNERAVRRVVVAGGTGTIGRALVASLIEDHFEVDVLTRDPERAARLLPADAVPVRWAGRLDPTRRADLAAVLAHADAIVNLAGAPISPLPWTAGRRRAILASRVESTAALVDALESLPPDRRPRILVNASGTDTYTDRDAEPATEATPPASGFLSEVVLRWEAAASKAEALGVRVVLVRTSFVLARGGQILRLLTLPFRLFVGGRVGSGRQWFSWIHLDDVVGLYRAAIADSAIRGPINASAPAPVRQRDLAGAIGRAVHRPSWLPVPAWAVRLALREQSTLVLGSRRVSAARAEAAGYAFRFTDLDQALRDVV